MVKGVTAAAVCHAGRLFAARLEWVVRLVRAPAAAALGRDALSRRRAHESEPDAFHPTVSAAASAMPEVGSARPVRVGHQLRPQVKQDGECGAQPNCLRDAILTESWASFAGQG